MHLYGFIIGIAIALGISYFENHNRVIPKNKLIYFEIGLIFCAILGARIYHVADQWSFYSQNPTLIPQTWLGGLGIFGALIGSLLYFLVFVDRKSYLDLLNSITPILPLCQAIGRIGNFVNHENPNWWFEAIFDVGLFIFINRYPQNPTAKYLVGYGLIRFVSEFYRQDTWVYQNIKIGQIISLIFIIIGLCLLQKNNIQPRFTKR